ncbi:MAG TPA: cytochrome c biogenesis protein CcdA [Planctomycetota bacterium]|nr:cytochrome c biogenesis protein CcdA [Planctomycetota bacterium]
MNRFPKASALLAIALWPALALALEGFEDPPFQVASTLAPAEAAAGGELTLTVTFTLRADVHLYKDSIKFRWDELKGVVEKEVVKPKGKEIPDLNSTEEGATAEAYEGAASVTVKFQVTGAAGETASIKGTVGYQGCTDRQCFRPAKFAISYEAAIVAGAAAPPSEGPAPAAAAREELGWLFVLKQLAKAFVWGLALSLTPCVYPMIPITMAVIGGQKEASRLKAILLSGVYVLGIAITYSALGVLVASLGASVRQAFQLPAVLVGIAAVFVLFALGMFDVVTIQAPAFLGGLGDRVVGRKKGVVGVLLLGVVSGLAAGPCVAGPLLSVLTEIAAIGNRALGAAMMFALAWGMGLLLIVAGASTGLLPKAGKWTLWVKHLIGFVLLWAALYFLRPVVRETAFWLGSAGLLVAGVVFLGGLDALTPESGFAARAKRVLGIAALVVAGWCALVGLDLEPRAGVGPVPGTAQPDPFLHGDPDLFKEALAAGKPIVLDFTAEWCGYCKVLDRTTFADPAVVAELKRFRALKIDYDASRNAELVKRFDVPGPPLIVVLDSNGELVKKLGYDEAKDPDKFAAFLKQVK